MSDSPPSLGTPSRLFAEEMVLRAFIDILETTLPGAKQRVFDLAHRRLTLAGPKVTQEHEFFDRAHTAIDAIMQVTRGDAVSLDIAPGSVPPQMPVLASARSQPDVDQLRDGKHLGARAH